MKNKIIIAFLLLAVLCFVFRKTLARWISGVANPDNTTKGQVLQVVTNNLAPFINVPSPIDGETYSEAFYLSFENDAIEIAQNLYNSMNATFTDESSMFSSTANLTSAELLCVYRAFGSKAYIPFFGNPINMNLFQWYAYVLSDDGVLMGGSGVVYYGDETAPHCDSWGDQCMEAFYNAMIWQKSGLDINPLTYYNTDEYPPE